MKKILIIGVLSLHIGMMSASDRPATKQDEETSTWWNAARTVGTVVGKAAGAALIGSIGGSSMGLTQEQRLRGAHAGAAAGFITSLFEQATEATTLEQTAPAPTHASVPTSPAVMGTPAEDPEKVRERALAEQRRRAQEIQAEQRTNALEAQLPKPHSLGNRTILVPKTNVANKYKYRIKPFLNQNLSPVDALHKLNCENGKHVFKSVEEEKEFIEIYSQSARRFKIIRGLHNRAIKIKQQNAANKISTWWKKIKTPTPSAPTPSPTAQLNEQIGNDTLPTSYLTDETKTEAPVILPLNRNGQLAIRAQLIAPGLGITAISAFPRSDLNAIRADKTSISNVPPAQNPQVVAGSFDMGGHDTNTLAAVGAPRSSSPVPADIQRLQTTIEIREVSVGKLPGQ